MPNLSGHTIESIDCHSDVLAAAAARWAVREAGLAGRATPQQVCGDIAVTNTLGAPSGATVRVAGLKKVRDKLAAHHSTLHRLHCIAALRSHHVLSLAVGQTLRVAHISDSHIDLGADEASGSAALCDFMEQAYAGGAKVRRLSPRSPGGHSVGFVSTNGSRISMPPLPCN